MTADPRAALTVLVAAFERHLEACSVARGADDPVVASAADALADAFESYDEALLSAYGELTPLEVYGEDDDSDDDEDEDDDLDDEADDDEDDDDPRDDGQLDDHDTEDGDDDRVYSGFDGDYDVERR